MWFQRTLGESGRGRCLAVCGVTCAREGAGDAPSHQALQGLAGGDLAQPLLHPVHPGRAVQPVQHDTRVRDLQRSMVTVSICIPSQAAWSEARSSQSSTMPAFVICSAARASTVSICIPSQAAWSSSWGILYSLRLSCHV